MIANRDRGNDVVAIEPDLERARVARNRGIAVVEAMLDDAFIAAHEPFDIVELRQTAGVEQGVYNQGKLRHIPVAMCEPMIRFAARRLP